ncbi:MAG: site-2 protease family protein [Mycolicibacterium sp.]|nr:site-2 protease family protein [Mycolicibacterium sp.]
MSDGIPLGTVSGVRVRANWSVLVLLWLFAWSLATSLPSMVPGYRKSDYWIAGVIGAAVLLASLLAHELTHAVVSRRAGLKVSSITLWMFGGVTRIEGEPKTPKTQFWIAFSGPLMSLLLSALFAGVAAVLRAAGVAPLAVAVAWWLSGINLLLALFNLLPGAPLDGGRMLQAILWRRCGDKTRATVGAARAGQVLGFVLIALGLVEFLTKSLVSGVWLVFIGWYLLTVAREEEKQALNQQSLAGVRVSDAMSANPRTAPGWISLSDFIENYLLGDRHSAYPVEAPDGSVTGLITLSQLRVVPPGKRESTLVRDAEIPLNQTPTADPDEPVTALLRRIPWATDRRVLVIDGDRVVGIVAPSDVTRLIETRGLVGST